jgi:hypothetical protein
VEQIDELKCDLTLKTFDTENLSKKEWKKLVMPLLFCSDFQMDAAALVQKDWEDWHTDCERTTRRRTPRYFNGVCGKTGCAARRAEHTLIADSLSC